MSSPNFALPSGVGGRKLSEDRVNAVADASIQQISRSADSADARAVTALARGVDRAESRKRGSTLGSASVTWAVGAP